MTVKTNRGILGLIFLSGITLGIYPLVFAIKLVKDVNISCQDDGKHTRGFFGMVLLSCITFGIYGIVWSIKFVCRVYGNAKLKGIKAKGSVAKFFIFTILLSETVICPWIALSNLIKTTNRIGEAHNQKVSQAAQAQAA